MVGVGWYLDVFGSDSHVLVWVFEVFFEKNHKKKGNGNLGKTGPFAATKGTLASTKCFAAVKGCLATAMPKGQKRPPYVRQGVALLRQGEGTVHRGKKFRILFRKPRIRTSIV